MSKKSTIDMSGLLVSKGEGTPSPDSPERSVITESTNSRIDEKTPSSQYVNLSFKVPKEFRHRLRKIAAECDVSLVEILREAIELFEDRLKK